MKMNKIKIALVCTSAIFFESLVVYGLGFFIYPHHHYYPPPPYAYILFAVSPLLSIISLFGSLLFVTEMKSKSNRWYLGIPLCIVILITIIAMILDFCHIGRHLLSDTSLTMLAPCSVVFFLSVPADRRKKVIIPVLISSIISGYALYSYYYLLRGMLAPHLTSWNVVGLLQGLYMVYGMSIVGMCFVAVAIIYKE
jgi:hypothetical protein